MNDTQYKPIVLVFTSWYKPFIGGSEVAIEKIASYLDREFEFHIITHRAHRDLPVFEKDGDVFIHRLGFGTLIDIRLVFPFLAFSKGRKLLKQLRGRQILLWGVMVSYASIGSFFIKVLNPSVPFLLTIQEGNEEWRFRWRNFGLAAIWWRAMMRNVDFLTAISSYLLNQAQALGYKGPAEVIPNGVDEELLRIERQDHAIPSIFVIFSASRLVYKNGIDILLQACAKLKNNCSFRLVLAGDGEEKKSLQYLVKKMSIEGQVEFLGMVSHDKLKNLYRSAYVFVRPSRTEGLGNAFLEAMAAGVLTIGTPVGGITDFLVDGDTGFLARPNDADDLAKTLQRAFSLNIHDRNKMIRNARMKVREQFLWGSISSRMKKRFLKLI